jgi:thiol-disulfide isomerase/thioredoxin
MKKLLFILVMTGCFASCSKSIPVDYVLLDGKIENLKESEITIRKSNRLNKQKIIADANGVFKDTIKGEDGFYTLAINKNKVFFYFEHGNEIKITADINKLKSSLIVSGKGAAATNYLSIKKEITSDLLKIESPYLKLKEGPFLNKAREIKGTLNNVVDTLKGLSNDFKTLEKRNLTYTYLNTLSRFNKFNENSNQVSEELKLGITNIDLNNIEDYNFSSSYYTLINAYYNEKINALMSKDSLDRGLASVKVYATIKNQIIKNELIYIAARSSITRTQNLKDFYNTFINASTDKKNNKKITKIYNSLIKVAKGSFSPKFFDYENHAGGTSSLEDYKGKYVYIDIWATWCSPCLAQLPDLKKVEKKFHDKNIEFLSISVDKPKDYEKWKKMVVDKDLQGVQLLADNNFNSKFIKDYAVIGIPRFILIDPHGKIVDENAPRPSDEKLIELFRELGI